MARKPNQNKNNKDNQVQEVQQTSKENTQKEPNNPKKEEIKKEPVMYVGEPVVNERFFLRPGQVFMEIPAYVKDEELREKFVPVSQVKDKQNQ